MKHYATEDLLRYFAGDFSAQEVIEFNKHLDGCSECRSRLDSAIDFEVALVDVVPDKKPGVIPSQKFEEMATSVAQAALAEQQKILPFITVRKIVWSIAAVVLLVISAALYKAFISRSVRDEMVASVPAIKTVVRSDIAPVSTLRRKPFLKPTRFGKKTLAVPSGNASLRVITNRETVAVAALDSGSALFSVEPNQYSTFKVETPDAEISVVGTVFDVWIEQGVTKVTVLEGRVSVKYKSIQQGVMLNREEVASADSLKIHVSKLTIQDTAGLSEYKKLIMPEEVINKTEETLLNNWNALLNEASALVGSHSFEEANAIYCKIIEANLRNSTEEIARFESAMLLIKQLNKREAGLQALESYIKLYPDGLFEEESMLELVKMSGSDVTKIHDNTIRFVSKYSDHPFSRRAAYENATKLRESGNFALAANLYEKFALLWPKDNRTEDAVYWRAKSALWAGDTAVCNSCSREYLRRYPSGRWIREIETPQSR